jgi:hypothetical protein
MTPYHINTLRESDYIECIIIIYNCTVTVIWKTILQAMILRKILVDYVAQKRGQTMIYKALHRQQKIEHYKPQ